MVTHSREIYFENAPEFLKACNELGYPHDTSTPHRPQSNGVGERCVRKVKEGTKCVLAQSGLHPLWWCYAMRCYCFLFNVCEPSVRQDGGPTLTPYRARFKEEFIGPLYPFGCSVEYQPSNPDYKEAGHALGTKTRRGIFYGEHLDKSGKFKGDLLVVDEQQMENAAHHVRVIPTRIRMGEVSVVKQADD